jgi:3-dehydroquinate dehydratase-1
MAPFESFQLVASTASLSVEPEARETADLLEFRMDMADSPVEALAAYDGELPILVTNRPEWEGGERVDDPGRREELLAALDVPAVAAVDLELRALEYPERKTDVQPVLDAAEAADIPVVTSVHDFDRTPCRRTLVDFVHRGCQHGSLAKLAVTPERPEDVLDLLGVTLDVTREGRTVATMAMGELGAHSRAMAPLYGSKLSYAPVSTGESTAPGQFDLETLDGLLTALGARSELKT